MFGIIICVIIIVIGITGVIYNKKLKANRKLDVIKSETKLTLLGEPDGSSFPLIQIIENNDIIPSENNRIQELKIKNIIEKADNILPKTIIAGKNIRNSKQLLNNNKAFFSALKEGTENMQSVGKTGKVLGGQMIKDPNSKRMLYNKQTQFTREDVLINSAGKNALVNAGFNTASMIVGQYYMNEINNKLEDIQNNISEISDYLDSEYQGKLIYIISKIKEIIDNKFEILSNEFSTKKRYDEVIDLESECTILLGQANEEINKSILKKDIDYKNYEQKLKIIFKWQTRQQLLQRLLLEIGNLRYILAKGNETSRLSHTQYNAYLELTNKTNIKLQEYHNELSRKFGVDTGKSRRNGEFYTFRKHTIGKIKEEWAYDKIDDEIVKILVSQKDIKSEKPYIKEKQDNIIQIQKYNGEYYNLLDEGKKGKSNNGVI